MTIRTSTSVQVYVAFKPKSLLPISYALLRPRWQCSFRVLLYFLLLIQLVLLTPVTSRTAIATYDAKSATDVGVDVCGLAYEGAAHDAV